MNIFSAFIFSSILLAKLTWSALRMAMIILGFYVSLITVVIVIFFLVLVNFKPMVQSYYTNHSVPAIHQESPLDLENGISAPQNDLEVQIEYWQTQLQKQPTSRDVLLNLSLLYQQNNQLDLANEYENKANLIDPNYKNSSQN